MTFKHLKLATAALGLLGILTSQTMAADPSPKGEKLKPYTQNTCLVTDEKLGSMGKPYVHEYQGREIKLCCKGCVKDFQKDPAKYMKKLEQAEKKGKSATSSADHKGHKH